MCNFKLYINKYQEFAVLLYTILYIIAEIENLALEAISEFILQTFGLMLSP